MLEAPFLSFVTPTYRRPQLLARCMDSVRRQTEPCEQLIVHDTVGLGIAGMYAALPRYAAALHGGYVHVLADDDELVADTVVARVRDRALAEGCPDVIVVRAYKNGLLLPLRPEGPPAQGAIDLGCVITRRDVWVAHVGDYGRRYEGDFDHVHAMWTAGRRFVFADLLFERGPALHGCPQDQAVAAGAPAGTWGR
ncbi:MAG: hypothetical protein AB7I13_00740 [Vicinamibacterales bacterium]